MKKLLRQFAFWILKIQKVNTAIYIEDRLSKLANGKYHSFDVKVSGCSGAYVMRKIEYNLYVDGYSFHSDEDLEKAFISLEKAMKRAVENKPNEIHI